MCHVVTDSDTVIWFIVASLRDVHSVYAPSQIGTPIRLQHPRWYDCSWNPAPLDQCSSRFKKGFYLVVQRSKYIPSFASFQPSTVPSPHSSRHFSLKVSRLAATFAWEHPAPWLPQCHWNFFKVSEFGWFNQIVYQRSSFLGWKVKGCENKPKESKKALPMCFFLVTKKTLQHIFVAMVWFSTDFGESLRILSFNVGILTTKDTSSPVLDFRNFSLMVQHRLGDGGLVVVPYSSHVGSAKISEQRVFCLRSVMSILKPFSSRLKSLKTVKPQDVFRMNICFCDIRCAIHLRQLPYCNAFKPVSHFN